MKYIIKQKNNPITAPEKMTIKDLWDSFLAYQDDKVRISTKVGYDYTEKHFKKLFDIKCVDYNIHHYEAWKKVMNKKNMKVVSKNDALKTLKALLHYGVKIYSKNSCSFSLSFNIFILNYCNTLTISNIKV